MSEWTGFRPETERWFEQRFGEATEIQDASRAAIAAGEHVLITAPTGSGKTLAAFLYALDRLLSGAWPTGRLSVLYISPLKALNTDIRENLTEPLEGLTAMFPNAPEVRTATRSGDTSQTERRRMLKQPPDILTTTPESLNLLLSSRGGRSILGDIRVVILDEVHAVAGTKRGVHLMTAVERLTRLCGEFQRIALSATVRPLDVVARFVGGAGVPGGAGVRGGAGVPGGARPVRVIEATDTKVLDIFVHTVDTRAGEEPQSPWVPMVGEFAGIVERNRSSLFFTTNRRDAERIALLLNEHAGRRIAYAHHGSLSREVRGIVEAKMRSGELEAIVATSSLELGIDIGSIDEVIFAKTPFSVTSCLQMAGRAGHQVGAESRARVYPLFGRDCLNAVVTARAAVERDIEPVTPVRKPLDVLAQVLLSMIAMEPHDLDELFDFIRGVDSYAELTREEFDAVIDLLAGKYRATRMRELEPRITVDRISGVATARPGVARLLYHSGGTIPDRGYYELRRAENGSRIGELDEEFVWERRIGEVFVLGNQVWRIAKITDRDVLVEPANTSQQAIPFWRGEPVWRHVQLCERLLDFLEEADALVSPPAGAPAGPAGQAGAAAAGRVTTDAETQLSAWIAAQAGDAPGAGGAPGAAGTRGAAGPTRANERASRGRLSISDAAAAELAGFLVSQSAHTGVGLPHRRRVVLEHIVEDESLPTRRVICHTLWGGAQNYPLSILLAAALEELTGAEVTATAENDAVLVELPRLTEGGGDDGSADSTAEAALELVARAFAALSVSPRHMIHTLGGRLEATGFFGGRFRENAGRALLLPKAGFDRRAPLWMTRRRSRRLLEAVSRFEDFPITIETWRSCLDDFFDLDGLAHRIAAVHDGEIEVARCRTTAASPFARNLLWETTNTGIYETDTGVQAPGSTVSEEAIQRSLLTPALRPTLPVDLVEQFRRRLQRTERGYAPVDSRGLIDWVTERTVLTPAEWEELLEALRRDRGALGEEGETEDALLAEAGTRILRVRKRGGARPTREAEGTALVTALEEVPRLCRAWDCKPEHLILEHLEREHLERLEPKGSAAAGPATAAHGSPAGENALHVLLEAAIRTEPAERSAETRAAAIQAIIVARMRYEAPRAVEAVAHDLLLSPADVAPVVSTLVADGTLADEVVVGDDPRGRICDIENLEWLLRRLRASQRPTVEPKPAPYIVPFLADWQGICERGSGIEGLKRALEPLLFYPARAELWEEAILPARVAGYAPPDLDRLLRETELLWLSPKPRQVTFGFRSELELLCDAASAARSETEARGETATGGGASTGGGAEARGGGAGAAASPAAALAAGGRMTLSDLAARLGRPRKAVIEALWGDVWSARVSADSYAPVRQGIRRRFKEPAPRASGTPGAPEPRDPWEPRGRRAEEGHAAAGAAARLRPARLATGRRGRGAVVLARRRAQLRRTR